MGLFSSLIYNFFFENIKMKNEKYKETVPANNFFEEIFYMVGSL